MGPGMFYDFLYKIRIINLPARTVAADGTFRDIELLGKLLY